MCIESITDVISKLAAAKGKGRRGTRRYLMSKTRKVASIVFAIAAFGAAATPAVADTPPGLQGYEGQPGNQGGHKNGGGTPNGLKGYEGQPGNQGGH